MLPFNMEVLLFMWVNKGRVLTLVNGTNSGVRHTWVSFPAPPLSSCVMLGKLLNFSEPLQNIQYIIFTLLCFLGFVGFLVNQLY